MEERNNKFRPQEVARNLRACSILLEELVSKLGCSVWSEGPFVVQLGEAFLRACFALRVGFNCIAFTNRNRYEPTPTAPSATLWARMSTIRRRLGIRRLDCWVYDRSSLALAIVTLPLSLSSSSLTAIVRGTNVKVSHMLT